MSRLPKFSFQRSPNARIPPTQTRSIPRDGQCLPSLGAEYRILGSPLGWKPQFKSDHSARVNFKDAKDILIPILICAKPSGEWQFNSYPSPPVPYLCVEGLFGSLLEQNLLNKTGMWGMFREDGMVRLILHLVWPTMPNQKTFQTICEGMAREVSRVFPLVQELLPPS